MKKNELLNVYAYLQSVFSSFSLPKDDTALSLQNEVWFGFLHPYNLKQIFAAINQHAKSNQFVNIAQIADICKNIAKIESGTFRDEYFYLNEITKAISYSNCRINFENLSSFSKEIVQSPSRLAQWSNMGEDFHKATAPILFKQIKAKLNQQELMDDYKEVNQIYTIPNTKLLLTQQMTNDE